MPLRSSCVLDIGAGTCRRNLQAQKSTRNERYNAHPSNMHCCTQKIRCIGVPATTPSRPVTGDTSMRSASAAELHCRGDWLTPDKCRKSVGIQAALLGPVKACERTLRRI